MKTIQLRLQIFVLKIGVKFDSNFLLKIMSPFFVKKTSQNYWIHGRALRLVYQNNLNFSELLDLDNSVTEHQKNLQVLVTEIYKVKNGRASEIMKGIFELENSSYNLKSSCSQSRRENIKTVQYGLQSVRCHGPKI